MSEYTNRFYELFERIPRQGPGSNECTRRAYAQVAPFLKQPRILDIGCGAGMQTLELARISQGRVTALDNHSFFLERLEKKSEQAGLKGRLDTVEASMDAIPFGDDSFDLIWSEGAIFIIGFDEGLKQWKRLLKPQGFLVVSEASWLKESPPEEIARYWQALCPDMQNEGGNRKRAEAQGYRMLDSFPLPGETWWQDYYDPILTEMNLLRQTHRNSEEAQQFYGQMEQEIDMHRRYGQWYGYVFYVMQLK